MSPEQAVGAELDVRSDIFSFGVILYQLACRKRPFHGATPQDTLHQVIVFDPPPLATVDSSVPPLLATLIENCLQKDKGKRPATMAFVAEELARLEKSVSPVPGISRRAVGLSVLGGAAAALAGGVWYSRRGDTIRRVVILLQAQQMSSGKRAGEPYIASPQDIFRAGWRFRLRAQSATPGFLYVINDGPGDNGRNRLWVLFPPGKPAAPSAAVETGWYVFAATAGTEELWLVWSSKLLAGFAPGQITDSGEAEKIRAVLTQATNASPAPNGEVTVEGSSDPLATRLELRHIG